MFAREERERDDGMKEKQRERETERDIGRERNIQKRK